MADDDVVNVSVNMRKEVVEEWRRLAADQNMTLPDALQKSIIIAKYFLDQQPNGVVNVLNKDGTATPVYLK